MKLIAEPFVLCFNRLFHDSGGTMRIWIVGLAFISTSCAHIDTGQADYRIADVPVVTTNRNLEPLPGNRCSKKLVEACDPILPSRVVRRYMPETSTGWSGFEANQVYSIEIEQGFVGSNILEGQVFGHQFGKTAEIAILANVFEFAAQADEASKRRFLENAEVPGKADDPSDVELKLVYFSDDLNRHQPMNFSNIPLRPRSNYGGGSIGIQLVVMEVDAQTGPVSSLLKTLAKFGQQALPVPGEAKDMLYDLGESLLTGSRDDKLLDYRFVLSAPTADDRAVQATFAPGRYVVRRSQNRTVDMGWEALRLDHNTSRLFIQDATGLKPVTDDLYMILNIRRYPDGTKPEFYQMADWSEFRATYQAAKDAQGAPLDTVTASLTGLLGTVRSDALGDDLKQKWVTSKNRLDLYSHRYAPDFDAIDVSQCKVAPAELKTRLDIAERQATDAIRGFVAAYQAALALKRKDAKGAVIGDEFDASDREKLVSSIAKTFMPWSGTGADPSAFGDAAAFEAAFIAASPPQNLKQVSLTAAKANALPLPTCETLMGL